MLKVGNKDLSKLVPIFKDQTSLSERALKAREHHSMHALIVRSYTMSGSLSLTIGSFLVLNFGNEFKFLDKIRRRFWKCG